MVIILVTKSDLYLPDAKRMINVIVNKDLKEYDIRMLPQAWELDDEFPDLKQIYGDYLSPFHLIYLKITLPNKFENTIFVTDLHPRSHHDTNGYLRSKIFANELGLQYLHKKEVDVQKLLTGETVRLNKKVKVRDDKQGCVLYTPYHNGYFLNTKGRKIIKMLQKGTNIKEIQQKLGSHEKILAFICRLVLMDIATVDNEDANQ
jgi:hypothetical protein